MIRHTLFTLSCFALTLTLVSAETCSSEFNLYPVYAGGSGQEFVNCIIHDEVNHLMILGGNTTSTDFSLFDPSTSESSGFLYALDYRGNWMWGIQFSNLTNSIATITGCHMSSDGAELSLLARNSLETPTVIVIEPADGRINQFYSLEYRSTDQENLPNYQTFGAIYFDTDDNKNRNYDYTYLSFIRDS